MRKGEMAALAEQQIPLERLRELFVQVDRGFVKRNAFRRPVVRPVDGGVAPAVSATEVAFLEYGDVADAMHGREVVRDAQSVDAGADDYDVVARLELVRAPHSLFAEKLHHSFPFIASSARKPNGIRWNSWPACITASHTLSP